VQRPAYTPPVNPRPVHQQQNIHYQPAARFATPIAAGPSRPVFTPQNAQPRNKPFIPPPLHVLIEFSINSTDRFLFPKNSILEFLPNGTLLASFLVVKKPSQITDLDITETKKTIKAKKAEELEKLQSLPMVKPSKGKKGAKEAEKEPPEKEYYEPVTVRFESPSDQAVFNVLARVVAPPDEVTKYMIGVAERCERAPLVKLALQLPNDKEDVQIA